MDISKLLNSDKQTLAVEVEINIEDGNSNDYNIRLSSPIIINGSIKKTDNQLALNAKISTKAIVECSRCLDDMDVSVEEDVVVYLVERDSSIMEEYDTFILDGKNLDLKNLALVEILDQIPLRLLCKEDCLGMCPQCGNNLNKEICKCNESENRIDARFDKLKELIK